MEPVRPDPDKLLQQVQEEEARQNRARLKIFFGAAPGVGKTYSMLVEARTRAAQGVDVVAGVVETHGRSETAVLAEGFETLPKRTLPYRGAQMEEFDLEAALKRKPALILMDELAHTNVPGSTHAKRWQDVWDLLDAGIDVYATVNVQHIESLRDVVAQITGIIVRENIPDTILRRADEMELVDIPPEELLQRLRDGKVYVPDQARYAIDRFFRRGNLLALRELALRRTAEHVDADMRRYMADQGIAKTWAAGERLLVCIGRGEAGAQTIRAAKRLAESLNAPWIACHVENMRHLRYSEANRERLEENLRLVERLGGETVVLPAGFNLADDILALATARNVTRILLGKPTRSRLLQAFTGSLLEDLVRRGKGIDVDVIAGEKGAPPSPQAAQRVRPALTWRHAAWSAGMVLVATALCALLSYRFRFELADTAMIYLLGILLVATRFGRWPSVLASAMSVLALDFFFVAPRFTFAVRDFRHFGTFLVMLAVGIVIGNLTERIRAQARLARTREHRTLALFRLSDELARSAGSAPLVESAIRSVAAQFQARVAIFLPDAHGRVRPTQKEASAGFREEEQGVCQWVFDHHESAGLGTDTLPGAKALYLPLMGAHGPIGVMGVMPEGVPRWAEPDQRHLLGAFANQTALALERALLVEKGAETQRQVDREQLRNALLSSVSHDLRTPLGSITGAASALLEEPDRLDPAARRELLETIHGEAHQLHRLVTNLLDVTRLESGVLEVHREWMPVEELVGSALDRMEAELAGRTVKVELPPSLPLVPVDPVLMEQVLINVLENAVKYAPAAAPIEIKAWATERALTLAIADRGPGIPEGQEERIFEKLVRLAHGDKRPGAGLGLAICRGILEAHGGRILAGNRPGGGAQFLVSLPLDGQPPRPPAEEVSDD